jgi:hypothetical protein
VGDPEEGGEAAGKLLESCSFAAPRLLWLQRYLVYRRKQFSQELRVDDLGAEALSKKRPFYRSA